jgi:hypothetical protein
MAARYIHFVSTLGLLMTAPAAMPELASAWV